MALRWSPAATDICKVAVHVLFEANTLSESVTVDLEPLLSSVPTPVVRSRSSGSMRVLSRALWRTGTETLRLSRSGAGFLLSSTQLRLLAVAPPGRRGPAGLRRRKPISGGLSGEKLQSGCPGLLWSEVLLELRIRGGGGEDGRGLDSNPEEDLLVDEDVFLSLPEINKWSVCRSCRCRSGVTCILSLKEEEKKLSRGQKSEFWGKRTNEIEMCAANEGRVKEKKRAVKSGEARSNLFLSQPAATGAHFRKR